MHLVTQQQKARTDRFKDVVSRINRTLVVLPNVTATMPAETEPEDGNTGGKTKDMTGNEDREGEEEAHEEREFVRATDRTTVQEEDDSIVIVGRKKKRKRAAVTSGQGEQLEVEEFDYAEVSNILDESGSGETLAQPKKKRATKG